MTKQVMVPVELTAENGAKAALMGELSIAYEQPCPACIDGLDEDDSDCEICNGEEYYTTKITVDWTTIKEIWRKAIEVVGEAAPQVDCSRSHPHENMDTFCELKTKIAELENKLAHYRVAPQVESEPVARVGILTEGKMGFWVEPENEEIFKSLQQGTKLYTQPQPEQRLAPTLYPGENLWSYCEMISDIPSVDEAIRTLLEDNTGDNATCLVREILLCAAKPAHGWIKCSDLLPTINDHDYLGNIWALTKRKKLILCPWHVVTDSPADFLEWIHTGLKEPQPPQEGE